MPEHRTFSPEHGGAPQDVRDAVRARLEVERANELSYLRLCMRGLYVQRSRFQAEGAYVTADDAARAYDHAIEHAALPGDVNRAFLGQVFKAPGWEKTGMMVKSRQPKNHARLLHCWKYTGE